MFIRQPLLVWSWAWHGIQAFAVSFCTTVSDSAHHLRSMDHAVEHGTGHTAHLDALEESVNRQIDTDIRVLLDNFREMIHLSRVCFDICVSTHSRLARKIIST